jgi:tetratricopeptide (TPR) repeat protein
MAFNGMAYQRGSILYRQGRYRMAAEEFLKELSAAPGNVTARSMLALSHVYDGKRPEALVEAQEAVAAGPENAFAHYALACVLVGKVPIKLSFGTRLKGATPAEEYQSRLKKAKTPAMEAVRLAPFNPDFLALMAAIELDQGKCTAALEWADRGLQASPDHIRCTNLRARVLTKMGRLEEATQTAAGALAIDPEHAPSHTTQGWAMLHSGEPEKALEHFTEAMRLNPEDAYTKRGFSKARLANKWLVRPIARIAPWAVSGRGLRILVLVMLIGTAVVIGIAIPKSGSSGTSDNSGGANWFGILPAVVIGVTAWSRRRNK